MKNLNTISPNFRDNLLNKNIGKYNQIDEPMIYPIGQFYDIYSNTPIKKESITPNGLLDYINNRYIFEKRGEFEKNIEVNSLLKRDKIPIDISYGKNELKQFSYIDGESYQGSNKNWATEINDIVTSYFLGDSIGISASLESANITSTSLDASTSLPDRIINLIAGNETKIGKIGLLNLGTSLASTMLQRSRINEEMASLFEKPIGFYDAIDTLDLDKMSSIQFPSGLINFSSKMLPIYLYTEVKKTDTKEYSWLNQGIMMNNNDQVIKGPDVMINENGDSIIIDESNFSSQSLLLKTQKLFSNGRIQTLVSKLSSSTDPTISKGRSLKDKDGKYLRAWTASKAYNKISSLISPFSTEESKNNLKNDLNRVRPNVNSSGSLEKYGVLQDDGFVKIAPYISDSNNGRFQKSDIKKYMFSIENLAWIDSIDSLIEGTSQEGPNGGRIMWFPPYDINFNETTSVNWNSDTFIGRGEPIYTYVNTERNGTLSFKMIVDHPSIINYYKQSKYTANGQPITEDDYLRFFAGDTVIKLPDENPNNDGTIPKKEEEAINKPKVSTFKVYFPNNYSGINDGYKDALQYLYQGHACSSEIVPGQVQGYENEIGDWKGLTNNNEEPCFENYWYRVDTVQNVTESQRKDVKSFGLNNSKDSDINSYSFREAYNLINSPTVPNTESDNAKTARNDYIREYINNVTLKIDMHEKSVDYLIAVENNDLLNISYYGALYDLAVSAYTESNLELQELDDKNKAVNKNGLFYVPITMENADQNSSNSYVDTELSRMKNVWNAYVESQKLVEETLNSYNNIKVAYSYTGNTGQVLYSEVEEKGIEYDDAIESYEINKTNLEYLLDIYMTAQSPTAYNDFYQLILDAQEIIIEGSASTHGIETQNSVLSNNRAKILKDWLMTINGNNSIYKTKIIKNESDVMPDKDISSKEAKINRYARVTISNKPGVVNTEGVANSTNATSNTNQTTTNNTNDNNISKLRIKKSFYGYYNDNKGTNIKNDEAQFFEKIGKSKDQSIIYDKLSEKIKYFSPAFHSMTPEGFNSRLTFLHQCTRQGPTSEATTTNSNSKSATNIAFGRPPICILRVGDFYNTKIVIDSLNIDFDPLVWDLNQEGIGVQPMIANVTINFKFIGGSDLTGPIARLQNAITFNFFANTGVYDDRNDRLIPVDENDPSKGLKYDTLYNPHIYDAGKLSKSEINNAVNAAINVVK